MAHEAGGFFKEDNLREIPNSNLTASTHEQLDVTQKTQFQIDCEGAITLEELREGLYKKIDELWQK